jgi:CSLREA domain-containing protein
MLATLAAGAAQAATITVNSVADPGASSICTLRDAITAANTSTAINGCTAGTGDDTIVFSVTGTILLTATLPDIAETLTIQGPATNPPAITISGQNSVQLMINDNTLSVAYLTLENASTTSDGGAIQNDGLALTVSNSVFTNNAASLGGALYSDTLLKVTDCTFNNNSVATLGAIGGAIFNDGTTTIIGSTFNGNKAVFGAGAVESEEGSLTVTNSTFVDNSSTTFAGGALDTFGTLLLTNSTFSGNSAPADAGGSAISVGGTADIKGTIVTASTGSNCTGTVTDKGFNLDDDGTCGFSSGTTPAAQIALGAAGLQNNGGPTQTVALASNSVAINQIPVADCTDQSSPPARLLTDQRGVIRPQFTACDIGAYEYDTARSLKSAVLNAIENTTGGNRADKSALKVAASNLAQAVRFYWSGTSGNELNPVAGILNFLAEERAVNALARTLIPSSQLPAATIENYLFNITLADRTLAVVAIANAGSNADASQLVATGDAQAAAGDYLAAVISYQKAWNLVSSN